MELTTQSVDLCPSCHTPVTLSTRLYTNAIAVKCETCGLVYSSHRPIDAWLEWKYNRYSDDDSHCALPRTKDEALHSPLRRPAFFDFIKPYVGGGALMDFGCSWGALLLEARKRGFHRCFGLERCFRSRMYGNGLFREIEGQCESKMYIASSHQMEMYNVITAIHSLEHVTNLKLTMVDIIGRSMAHGGIFAGVVPNFGSAASMILKDKWRWLDPYMHTIFFTPMSLTDVLSKFEFDMAAMQTRTGDGALSLLDAGIGSAEESDNNSKMLGEEIWFVARKRSTLL